ANKVVHLLTDVDNGVLLEADAGSGTFLLRLGLSGLLLSGFHRALDIKGLLAELLSILGGVTNVDVVEQDVILHRPDFETNLRALVSLMFNNVKTSLGG